jgi:hypothetical protein
MKLLHRKRRRREEREQLERDIRNLREVKDRWPAVNDAARSMRAGLQRNHFAESIGRAMGIER